MLELPRFQIYAIVFGIFMPQVCNVYNCGQYSTSVKLFDIMSFKLEKWKRAMHSFPKLKLGRDHIYSNYLSSGDLILVKVILNIIFNWPSRSLTTFNCLLCEV